MLVKIAVELTEPERLARREKFGRRLGATAGALTGLALPVPGSSILGAIGGYYGGKHLGRKYHASEEAHLKERQALAKKNSK